MSPDSAGYSATPLWKKLGVKPDGHLLLLDPPAGWSLGELPPGASQATLSGASQATLPGADPPGPGAVGAAGEVTVAFVRGLGELAEAIEPLSRAIYPAGALWVAWPRTAGGHDSDIREQDIRDLALPLGLVDNKVAALDHDWSGLRLVWRIARRGG